MSSAPGITPNVTQRDQRDALTIEHARTEAIVPDARSGGEPQGGPSAVRARIKTIDDDFVAAVIITGALGSEVEGTQSIDVRKALGVMRSTYESDSDFTYSDAQTRIYDSGGDDEETQTVEPPYVVGQEITILRGRKGGEWGKDYPAETAKQMNWREDNSEYARVWGNAC